jgi:membrane protease YdiL (CAAX protease family)
MTNDREPLDEALHREVAPPPEPIPQIDPYPNAGGALFAHIPRSVPHLGHAAIFGGIVFIVMLGVMFAVGLGGTLHFFGATSFDKFQRNPMVVVPTMAVAYLLVWLVSWFFFPLMWYRPFLDGISWNLGVARRRGIRLVITGLGLGLVVQFLSNFLPIPKTLPIDDFFKTRSSVWMVSVFGILFAPAFEELAFRGFLLPSLATAWDWLAHRIQRQPERHIDPVSGQAQWSMTAMVFAAVATSIPFALLHAEQLAHAVAPLAVLFGVSIVLCIVRFRTSSLAASVFVHASYNLSIFATLYLATDGFRNLDKLHG